MAQRPKQNEPVGPPGPPPAPADQLLSPEECARAIGASRLAWQKLWESGQAPKPVLQLNFGSGQRIHRRWSKRQLDEWMAGLCETAAR